MGCSSPSDTGYKPMTVARKAVPERIVMAPRSAGPSTTEALAGLILGE